MQLFSNRPTRGLLAVSLAAVAVGAAPAAQPAGLVSPPPAVAGFGRIEGTVIISSVLVARRPRFRIYNDPGPGALPPPAAPSDSSDEMRNIVVYIGPAGSGAALAASPAPQTRRAAMTQKDEVFQPHVLPVVRGTSVAFPNADDVYHNVFSLSSANSFDLGRYPKGSSRSLTFAKSGRVDVFCHIHSDMNAIVLVLDNPYFTSPDAKGHFVIDSVPAGDYTMVGWHQRIKPVQQRIHVVAGASAKMVFTIPLPSPDSP